jgi:hypothetical protein
MRAGDSTFQGAPAAPKERDGAVEVTAEAAMSAMPARPAGVEEDVGGRIGAGVDVCTRPSTLTRPMPAAT